MIALAAATSKRSLGDSRAEVRFYPCPASGGFHLTSEAAPSWDKGKYARLSAMVVANADRVLSAASRDIPKIGDRNDDKAFTPYAACHWARFHEG